MIFVTVFNLLLTFCIILENWFIVTMSYFI